MPHNRRPVPLAAPEFQIPEDRMLLPLDLSDVEGVATLLGADSGELPRGDRGRITVLCLAEAFSRERIEEAIEKHLPGAGLQMYPGTVYLPLSRPDGHWRDAFFHDYGVAVFWNLSDQEQLDTTKLLQKCIHKDMPADEVSSCQFAFHYSLSEPPNIRNDV